MFIFKYQLMQNAKWALLIIIYLDTSNNHTTTTKSDYF